MAWWLPGASLIWFLEQNEHGHPTSSIKEAVHATDNYFLKVKTSQQMWTRTSHIQHQRGGACNRQVSTLDIALYRQSPANHYWWKSLCKLKNKTKQKWALLYNTRNILFLFSSVLPVRQNVLRGLVSLRNCTAAQQPQRTNTNWQMCRQHGRQTG